VRGQHAGGTDGRKYREHEQTRVRVVAERRRGGGQDRDAERVGESADHGANR
jgi:hypothetical protein